MADGGEGDALRVAIALLPQEGENRITERHAMQRRPVLIAREALAGVRRGPLPFRESIVVISTAVLRVNDVPVQVVLGLRARVPLDGGRALGSRPVSSCS